MSGMHVACFVAAPQAEGLDVSFSLGARIDESRTKGHKSHLVPLSL